MSNPFFLLSCSPLTESVEPCSQYVLTEMVEKVFRFMRFKKLRQPKKLVNTIVSLSIYSYFQIIETFSNSNDHTKVRGRGNEKNYRSVETRKDLHTNRRSDLVLSSFYLERLFYQRLISTPIPQSRPADSIISRHDRNRRSRIKSQTVVSGRLIAIAWYNELVRFVRMSRTSWKGSCEKMKGLERER